MLRATRTPVLVGFALALLLGAAACRATPELTIVDAQPIEAASGNARNTSPTPESNRADSPLADATNGGGIDFLLTRDDIDCGANDLYLLPDLPVVVAHVVVDGNLGAACFGEPDRRLVDAWRVLASITPPGELHELGMFTGFVSEERGQTTLAFVNQIDPPRPQYQMSVNLEEADDDPIELLLTMAHEFAHVMTANPTQIDASLRPKDCETWHNLRGCFRDDSLMWLWIEAFWGDGLIGGVNQKLEPSPDVGLERCAMNPGFFGPYGASHPEEDFAEAFSAFVFRIEPDSADQRAKLEWFADQPALQRFRNQAIESGLGPLRYRFEPCGSPS